ncbi:MAG: hypothetical protein QHH14_13935 [Clostridiales bacterium]|nr:hypothetical protein [Clostridiales bacterium]
MRIYITYCSWQKDDSLRGTGVRVTPDKLYRSPRIQGFIARCREKRANWAIFSDFCGVWFPEKTLPWYDLHPDKVTKEEEAKLASAFYDSLKDYGEIHYYPDTLHPLSKRIVTQSGLENRVSWFTDLNTVE